MLAEAQSEAEEAAAKTRGVFHEVVHCIAAAGSDAAHWRSGRVTMSDTGLEFEASQGQPSLGDVQLVTWADVARLEVREPSAAGSASSRMYEAQLELCRPPGRLRLQFGYAQPAHWLDSLWKASGASCSSSGVSSATPQVPGADTFGPEVAQATVEALCLRDAEFHKAQQQMGLHSRTAQAWQSLFRDYERSDWTLAAELIHVHRAELSCPTATPAGIREELRRTDVDCALMRLWQGKNVTEFAHPAWAPLGSGQARCLGFRLPLKPIPMAPKSSRVSVFYHLLGDADSTELAWMTKSLDVPYANSFVLMGKFVFSKCEKGVVVDCLMGWKWLGRCMIKTVIKSQSRVETAETCEQLAGHICTALSRPAPPPATGIGA